MLNKIKNIKNKSLDLVYCISIAASFTALTINAYKADVSGALENLFALMAMLVIFSYTKIVKQLEDQLEYKDKEIEALERILELNEKIFGIFKKFS
ncbi:hypothetical protein [Desnuesiella massiliensis]|uniref:hypothetical protein n=1 Tax=Desnuesiella massiliensis TaxID=1650662 RepID=UPI0006E2A9A9|nr:hypothetical protein [Desnuesiella massiliensis]